MAPSRTPGGTGAQPCYIFSSSSPVRLHRQGAGAPEQLGDTAADGNGSDQGVPAADLATHHHPAELAPPPPRLLPHHRPRATS